MPSSSDKQARAMAAAGHSPAFARKVGIPQGVAQDFNAADTGMARLSHAMRRQKAQADALRKRRTSGKAESTGEEGP